MNIGILGSGNIGGSLARAWTRLAHEVCLGVRSGSVSDPKVLALAKETGAQVAAARANDAAVVRRCIRTRAVDKLDSL